MFTSLKNHPFAVEAFFETSLVLTFAVPKEQLKGMIPECLELDTFKDTWAFIAVAMVQTTGLRPKGFPAIFGTDFFLIGYRIFVTYTNKDGKRLRGLYILKSETDKKRMEWLGNMFTRYRYTTTDISVSSAGDSTTIHSKRSKFKITFDAEGTDIALPARSPFSDWKEARRFAGPLPFTFSYDAAARNVLIIEGVRQNWTPLPVKVLHYRFNFLRSLQFQSVQLANAFIIRKIPYYWKKGRVEKWQP
ncbi:MAG: DUF2071 domain-containing protein [Chitinophagaceae bacterium]